MSNFVGLKFWNGSEWIQVSRPGPAGKSAYQIAVENGYLGTEEQFAESLDTSNIPAANVKLTAGVFNGNLDPSVQDVQALAEAVDDLQSASQLVIQDEGVARPVRPTLNVVGNGLVAVDDVVNNRTNLILTTGTRNDPGLHSPLTSGRIDDFGVTGRAYYVPFIAPDVSFTRANFNVVAGTGLGDVRIAIYEYTGGFTLNKVKTFGTFNSWSTPTGTFGITAATPWVPTPETRYYIGVLVTGVGTKLMSGNLIPTSQWNGTAAIWPPGAGYQSAETNLTDLPATDLAPFLGGYTEKAPIIQLQTV